jgi:hypothetical protein
MTPSLKRTPIVEKKFFGYFNKNVLCLLQSEHMSKLELALSKYYKRKETNPPYYLTLQEFVIDCFLDYSPSSYGKYIQEKIINSCIVEDVNIKRISDKDNKGDCELVYPLNSLNTFYIKDSKKIPFTWTPSQKFVIRKNYEIKVSYLGKNNCYTLRNIRPYQTVSGGYIICLIDCVSDFQPNFYLVDEDVIFNNFTLSHMNGVSSEHTNNSFENYGASIGDESHSHFILKKHNQLKGTTLEDLISYLKENQEEMKTEFFKRKDELLLEFNEGCERYLARQHLNNF